MFCNIFTHAQSSRQPTDAEKKAINKAVHIITPMIDSFENDEWKKEAGGADDEDNYSIQTHPDVAMSVAPFNEWDFTVRQGSPIWNTSIQPYLNKTEQTNFSDPQAVATLQKEGAKVKALQHIYVEIHVNDKSIPGRPNNSIPTAGVTYAYKQTPGAFTGTDHNLPSYVLVFGNWKNAVFNNSFNASQFHFAHAFGTPYIENIVIIMSGNEARIKELITTLNWNEINNALTL
jgi:hypothetical protein